MAMIKDHVKVVMLKGERGIQGERGVGFPTGGKAGQFLRKKGDSDFEFEWGNLVPLEAITNSEIDSITGD